MGRCNHGKKPSESIYLGMSVSFSRNTPQLAVGQWASEHCGLSLSAYPSKIACIYIISTAKKQTWVDPIDDGVTDKESMCTPSSPEHETRFLSVTASGLFILWMHILTPILHWDYFVGTCLCSRSALYDWQLFCRPNRSIQVKEPNNCWQFSFHPQTHYVA